MADEPKEPPAPEGQRAEQLRRQRAAGDAPLAAALAQGLVVRDQLLAAAGGGLTTTQVARMLHVKPQAVAKATAARRLLGVTVSEREVRFPAAQFKQNKPLPGLAVVLRAARLEDPWMQLEHMSAQHPALGRRSIFEALADGEVDRAAQVMASVGEPGL